MDTSGNHTGQRLTDKTDRSSLGLFPTGGDVTWSPLPAPTIEAASLPQFREGLCAGTGAGLLRAACLPSWTRWRERRDREETVRHTPRRSRWLALARRPSLLLCPRRHRLPCRALKGLTGKTVRVSVLSGCRPYPSEWEFAEGVWSPAKEGLQQKTPRSGGVQTPTALPTVGLIVPVFGLALAPCWRSAGCRALHRASALGASLDRYETRLCEGRIFRHYKFAGGDFGGTGPRPTLRRARVGDLRRRVCL